MPKQRYEVEPLGEAHDTLTEVNLEIIINNILQHGQVNESRTRTVYGEYSIGRMGVVWHGSKPIGQVVGWSGVQRRKHGLE